MEKLKTNFIIINLKRYLISIISLAFVITLILYSETNIIAAKNGLKLWANSVIPSLFPFFVATEILCSTNLVYLAGKFLRKPIQKIFNVPRRRCNCSHNGDNKWISYGSKNCCEF